MITLLVTRGWGVQEKYCTILSVTRGRVVQDILYKFICHQKLGRYKKYDTTLSVTRGWEIQEKYCTILSVTRGRLVQEILYKFICHQKLGRYKKYDTTLSVTRGWEVQEKYCTISFVTRGRLVQDILYKFICHQKLGRYKKYNTTLSVTRGRGVQEKNCTISFVNIEASPVQENGAIKSGTRSIYCIISAQQKTSLYKKYGTIVFRLYIPLKFCTTSNEPGFELTALKTIQF